MSDLNVFWVNKIEGEGVPGTEFSAQNMGLIHPSVNSAQEQYLVPIPENPRGFIFKGGTYIKLLIPNEHGGSDHLVFGSARDLVVNYPEQRLDVGVSFQAGRDYNIYMCYKAPTLENKTAQADLVISLNSTYPQGYSADTSRKIGGFHTLCVNASTIAGHPLSGFAAGDILPASFWCLTHRPTCQPEGMVYIKELDFWVDIYLQSGNGVNTKSIYGGTITDTRNYMDYVDDLAAVGKTPLSDEEFQIVAEGSNQQTRINGNADPVSTGGHSDTAGRRMISNYGLEDCCGALWQWVQGGGWRYTTTARNGETFTPIPEADTMGGIHAAVTNNWPGGKGQLYFSDGRSGLLAGGCWYTVPTACGSRCRYAAYRRFDVGSNVGCRGRARSRAR